MEHSESAPEASIFLRIYLAAVVDAWPGLPEAIRAGILASCGVLAAFAAWSALAREPAIDAMKLPPPPARGLRAALWEALTAASHRAQLAEPRAAEPLED